MNNDVRKAEAKVNEAIKLLNEVEANVGKAEIGKEDIK